jgi:hypothetical protein
VQGIEERSVWCDTTSTRNLRPLRVGLVSKGKTRPLPRPEERNGRTPEVFHARVDRLADEEQAMTRSRTDQPATNTQHRVEQHDRRSAGEDVRERLLAGIPVTERQLELAGGAATSVACTCP